jgi:predicted phosphodiesterase
VTVTAHTPTSRRACTRTARGAPAPHTLQKPTATPLPPPYNPHWLRRRSYAVQFNEVYPQGLAPGHVRVASAVRIKPSSFSGQILIDRTSGLAMRIAALYDIHGNLPALEAVLAEVRTAGVDRIVVGGDVVPGPMPCETVNLLLSLETPVHFIYGNGELAVLAQVDATDPDNVTYWGTTSGEPLPEPLRDLLRWTGGELETRHLQLFRTWPATLELDIPGLGAVLFCHGTPRSETEGFTRLTSEDTLLPVFRERGDTMVVCGHTHMPFDRRIGMTRVINAGSIGMPFGRPGADWLLLDEGVQLRHTLYDFAAAAARVRSSPYPQADEFARTIQEPPTEEAMLAAFTNISFR